MRLRTRAIVLSVIFIMFFVMFRLIGPDLELPPEEHKRNKFKSKNEIKDCDKPRTTKLSTELNEIVGKYIERYRLLLNGTAQDVFRIAGDWVSARQIHPDLTPELGSIIHRLSTSRIVHAGLGYRGTQLKMSLVLEGDQRVAFKPKWYERGDIVTGKPYDGPDRHNGEIAAFHLNRILGFQRAPIVAGRVLDLETEIRPVAEEKLLDTFFMRDGNTCFFGKCFYCKGPETGVCAKGNKLEGVMVLWLPNQWKLKNWKHPWRRTYRDDILSPWETDDKYCNKVRHTPPFSSGPRLPDIIDATVLDYLIGNADRHHYETFNGYNDSALLLLDNAKSFGNPVHDEFSILAPLYQCCMIRKTTWQRLQDLQYGVLSEILHEILAQDILSPVLAEAHFAAVDRRLEIIVDTVSKCIDERGQHNVLVN